MYKGFAMLGRQLYKQLSTQKSKRCKLSDNDHILAELLHAECKICSEAYNLICLCLE